MRRREGGREVPQSVNKPGSALLSGAELYEDSVITLLHVCILSSCTKRGKIQERYEEEMRRAEIDPRPHPSGAVNRQ